jgi:hypothetical protein
MIGTTGPLEGQRRNHQNLMIEYEKYIKKTVLVYEKYIKRQYLVWVMIRYGYGLIDIYK